jgi:tetratricopeptide (TPR) repeat protein
MPGVRTHLEDFLILRYVADELSSEERRSVARHLVACSECATKRVEIERLDAGLKELAANGALDGSTESGLDRGDPFHRRPQASPATPARTHPPTLGLDAITASAEGQTLAPAILEAARQPQAMTSFLSTLDPERGANRFAVLYALSEAGRTSAEDPNRAKVFATSALAWIRLAAPSGPDRIDSGAESMVPRLALRAQAHLLLAICCLWTHRYSRARAHLIVAYRGFAEGGGDETKLAVVELAEAQRRALSHEPLSAIPLARRARETFADRGMDDYAARTWVAEGLALYELDRNEDALRAYREALPVFEASRLWSNYVGALNSIATSLNRLGRHEEARREYARALRHLSRDEHRSWLGYVRFGLAEALFAAGRFAEAATAAGRAARVFSDSRLRAQSLTAMLLEVESWARHGDLARAELRLRLFWIEVERDGHLDRVVLDDLQAALSGSNPNFERLATLRELASTQIQERYRTG